MLEALFDAVVIAHLGVAGALGRWDCVDHPPDLQEREREREREREIFNY
jgi:hypothetical protein